MGTVYVGLEGGWLDGWMAGAVKGRKQLKKDDFKGVEF